VMAVDISSETAIMAKIVSMDYFWWLSLVGIRLERIDINCRSPKTLIFGKWAPFFSIAIRLQ